MTTQVFNHIPVVIEDLLHPGGVTRFCKKCMAPHCPLQQHLQDCHAPSTVPQGWFRHFQLLPDVTEGDFGLPKLNFSPLSGIFSEIFSWLQPWWDWPEICNTFCLIGNNARRRVFILGQWNLVIFNIWLWSFMCYWLQDSIISWDQDIEFLRQDFPGPLFVEMVFIAFWRFSQPLVYTEICWMYRHVQWALAGKCLINLLFAVFHHGQLLCSPLCVFFFFTRRGVDYLTVVG